MESRRNAVAWFYSFTLISILFIGPMGCRAKQIDNNCQLTRDNMINVKDLHGLINFTSEGTFFYPAAEKSEKWWVSYQEKDVSIPRRFGEYKVEINGIRTIRPGQCGHMGTSKYALSLQDLLIVK